MTDFQSYLFYFLIWLISTTFILAFFKSTHAKSHLPSSPFRLPVIGHLHLLGPIPHQAFHRLSLQYGPVFRLFLGSEPCVVACSPETAKEILKTYENAYLDRPRNSATIYLTYGLKDFAFTPYGPYWKFMKKIVMSQLLKGATVDSLIQVRQDKINRFIKSLSRKASIGEAINVNAELVKVTNNLISRILLSERCSENAGEADNIRKLIFEITDVLGTHKLSDHIWLFKNLDLQGFGKRVKDIRRRFDVLVEKIIKEHEAARTQGLQSQEKDLLSILLDIAEEERIDIAFTRENIKAFIQNIFVAGTDNSAIIAEWALSELINHPNVMKKAIAEIDNVAVVKETLRLHPPVPMIPRKSTEDRVVAGYHIQANTTIFINVWALGRDPNHWENSLAFRPEIFEENQMDVRGQHFELLPFGSGRRMCPGTSLGLQMVYATFGAMIQCFEWKAGKDGNLTSVDMDEGRGLNLPKANPLVCVPVARLDPIPLSIN
ncbi:putative 3,9-dihydroxypterocarpan 6A-monooxygenase [Helianthus annuus]|nr:putative 3,9-dihydroxypterocarpan 6A-monooxygenase [Helianthus annuus]